MRSKRRPGQKGFREPNYVRTKFYYVRTNDEQNFPVVAICLKHDPMAKRVSRGISICAMDIEKEQKRNKRTGRGIAESRARHALYNQCKHLKISNDAWNNMHVDAYHFLEKKGITHMCDNAPPLSEKEIKILKLDSAYKMPLNQLIDTEFPYPPCTEPPRKNWVKRFLDCITPTVW